MLQTSWDIKESDHIAVNKYDFHHFVAAFRHSLLKSGNERHTEEFVLRELFREFARDGDGQITITELRCILNKININTEEKYLDAFVKAMDKNNLGYIEFEELRHVIIEGRYTKV